MTPFIPPSAKLPLYVTENAKQGLMSGQENTAQGLMSLPEMAGAAEKIVKDVMRVEPMIAGISGMFVPGLSLVQPWIVMLAPYLEKALDDLSKGNNGDLLISFVQLAQHLSSNMPNAPALTPGSDRVYRPDDSHSSSLSIPSRDASEQGSG